MNNKCHIRLEYYDEKDYVCNMLYNVLYCIHGVTVLQGG